MLDDEFANRIIFNMKTLFRYVNGICGWLLLSVVLHAQAVPDTSRTMPPSLKAAYLRIEQALKEPVPVITLKDSLNANQQVAQQVALEHAFFRQNLFEPTSKKPLRNEIFGVYLARSTDFRSQQIASNCGANACYRVEMYNYPLNLTTVGLVNVNTKAMIDGYLMNQSQPNISPFLKQVALDIATSSPEVISAMGFKPNSNQAIMSDTKTALNESRCERSKHLCVAPTFVQGDRALWAIIDLTDMKLVGVRWTNVGNPGPAQMVTERKYQNEEITERYCTTPLNINRDGWALNYIITSSDGLQVSEANFQGKRAFDSAKLVDWHVSYSEPEGFGYSDAIGCPYFSTAAVVAIEPPVVKDLMIDGKKMGFELTQNFYSEGWPQACNYNYQQRFEFYEDGRFRVAAASLGRGCGNNGTYRPVTRIAFPNTPQTFYEWQNNRWMPWTKEKWQLQKPTTTYTTEGYQYQVKDATGNGYSILANRGQMNDQNRSDNAYLFVTKRHKDKDEGDSDLVTIGPCCNADYQQGPEKFMLPRPEPISQSSLVMWYVPQLRNDDTKGREFCWSESYINDQGVYSTRIYPCLSGPMFVPLKR